MILDQTAIARAGELVTELTGEVIRPGDRHWEGVIARALELGACYKRLWETKHGQIQAVKEAARVPASGFEAHQVPREPAGGNDASPDGQTG